MNKDDYVIINGELYHYGVLDMKWGVRRAARKTAANERLLKKAYKYDAKSAKLTKKSEKAHAKLDLERSNKAAVKSAKLKKKSANLHKKALKTENELKRLRLERKAEKKAFKASKLKIDGNRLSKTTGYGMKAMRYSIKSDIAAKKAAKARYKISKNKVYSEMMNRKMSTLSTDKLRKVETPIMDLIKNSIHK